MGLVKYNNLSISSIDDVSNTDGAMTLIKTVTASSDSTISFVNGSSDVVLDSTYPIYLFKFINVHPSSDNNDFSVNFSDDTSSHSYDLNKVTTYWGPMQAEGGTAQELAYMSSQDLVGTGFQQIFRDMGADNDQSGSGEMWLFNPSSTTYVTHFISKIQGNNFNDYTEMGNIAGYINTTAAVTAVQFKFGSNNIDSGLIKLYGIKDS